jgi:hypothetical protein
LAAAAAAEHAGEAGAAAFWAEAAGGSVCEASVAGAQQAAT